MQHGLPLTSDDWEQFLSLSSGTISMKSGTHESPSILAHQQHHELFCSCVIHVLLKTNQEAEFWVIEHVKVAAVHAVHYNLEYEPPLRWVTQPGVQQLPCCVATSVARSVVQSHTTCPTTSPCNFLCWQRQLAISVVIQCCLRLMTPLTGVG